MSRDFLGQGLAFPIRPTGGRLPVASGPAKVQQSIYLILSTAPGERVMLPKFGCGIHDLVFQPNTASLRGIVREKVREALTTFEPRIDVLDVTVGNADGERNRLDIAIDYRIRANNALYNLVYPFYLAEGAQG